MSSSISFGSNEKSSGSLTSLLRDRNICFHSKGQYNTDYHQLNKQKKTKSKERTPTPFGVWLPPPSLPKTEKCRVGEVWAWLYMRPPLP
jgi:hypothetical protein